MLLILSLTIVSHGIRLPALIKGLKVKHAHTPRQHATHALGIVLRRPRRVRLCNAIRRPAGSRPPSLAIPDLDVLRARQVLDMFDGLGHVVKVDVVGAGGLLDGLVLPVGEGVDEQDVDAGGDEGVSRAVGVLVPRVCRADLDV